jgi:hypothetical protein
MEPSSIYINGIEYHIHMEPTSSIYLNGIEYHIPLAVWEYIQLLESSSY